jgi:hypothetical protein
MWVRARADSRNWWELIPGAEPVPQCSTLRNRMYSRHVTLVPFKSTIQPLYFATVPPRLLLISLSYLEQLDNDQQLELEETYRKHVHEQLREHK